MNSSGSSTICALVWITILLQMVECVTPQRTLKSEDHTTYFSTIIAFGDSFTDNGNGTWILSNKTWPNDPHYYNGRFSNGAVWIEYVSGNLSIPLVDYATGGATTSNSLVQGYTGPNNSIPVPSVDQQVSNFLRDTPTDIVTDNLLFVLFGGGNDIFFNSNVTAAQSFREIMASRSLLSSRFPNATFMILNYPDLSRIPYAYYTTWLKRRELRAFSNELDSLYRQSTMKDTLSTSFQTIYVNLSELFDQWNYHTEPRDYCFPPLGAYGSCSVGVYEETEHECLCYFPNVKVFRDEFHPTSHAHSVIAKKVLDELRAQKRHEWNQ